jgi:TolA-binding protein
MKLTLGILTAVLLAALAALWLGARQSGVLRAERDALRVELETLREAQGAGDHRARQQETELERLRAEARELLKLRGEINTLRSGLKELDTLRVENRRLQEAARAPRPAAPAEAPAARPAAADQFPRDQWAFAGYGTPEAALISAVWAMREGRPQTYLESLSPEEQTRMAAAWQNKTEAEVAAKHQQDVAAITGVRILERQTVSPEEVVLSVHVEGVERVEKVSMKRAGQDWKFGGFRREPAKP